jgi:hypothetical protein
MGNMLPMKTMDEKTVIIGRKASDLYSTSVGIIIQWQCSL